MSRLLIDGVEYAPVPITRVSMIEGYRLEQELKREGLTPCRWLDIVGMVADDANAAEYGGFLTMVAVWAARRGAGEKVSFVEANSYSVADLSVIADEADEPEPEGKA